MARSRVLSFMSQWGSPQSRSPSDTPPPSSPTRISKPPGSSTTEIKPSPAPPNAPGPVVTPSQSTTQLANPAESSPTPRQRERTGSRPSSRPNSMVQTYQPPLMEVAQDTLPELQPIFTYLNSHSNKLYQEGYFLKLHDLDTRGRPSADRAWQECFAQLVGTVLSLWDAAELDAAGEDGEVVPSFINLADASIKMLESLPMNEGGHVLSNVLSISTAANNRYLLHFNSLNSLTQWTAGIRLSLFEHTTLQEAYTGSLIAGKGKTLNNIRTIMDRTRFKYEDWARVRFGAGTPWRRCWFVVTPPDEKEYQKLQKQWKKKTPYEKMPSVKGDLKFYETRKITKKTKPIATITDAWSAYAVYPQSKPLIEQSTLVKIEGRITIHSVPESSADGFVFVMPEVHPAVSGFEIMLRFLFPVWDTYALYGRPNKLIAETLDSRSLMFAMPRDRRYGYLEILDISGLIHTEGSQNWTERHWRKEMKSLTSKRMATSMDDANPSRRSSSRRNTVGRASLPPSRSNTLRFEKSGSGRSSPAHGVEFAGADLRRSSLSHRRSASEALGYRSSPKQGPTRLPELKGGYDSDTTPPRPPVHRTLYATDGAPGLLSPDNYETASEGRESLEADTTPPPSSTVLPEMRKLRSPEPVAPPPSFAHAPSSKPATQPNQAPELRRGHSHLDDATLSQMAEANQAPSLPGGAVQLPYGAPAYESHAVGDVESGSAESSSGVNPVNNKRADMPADSQLEGTLGAAAGLTHAPFAATPPAPYVQGVASSSEPTFSSIPANDAPPAVPPHSQQFSFPPSGSQGSRPSTASSHNQSVPAYVAQPGLARSSSSFSVQRKPLTRSSTEVHPHRQSQQSQGGSASRPESSDKMAAEVSNMGFPRDTSPSKPRMGKKKTVGSVDLTKQDILVGDTHYTREQEHNPANDNVPAIDFGPTYRLDPSKKIGPPSPAASTGAGSSPAGTPSSQTDNSFLPPPDNNRSTSSLGNRPNHTPTGSQTRLPLRPAYAHKSTPSVESMAGKGLSASGRSTPSGLGRASPSAPDRDQQHLETMQRIEGLMGQIAGVELRPIEMDPISYDGQTLPRVLVYFLQQFRPRGPAITVDDPRERQERSRILAIAKQVFQRFEHEQWLKREANARQRAERPSPAGTVGTMSPPGKQAQLQQQQQQQNYVDPRHVDQLQQQVRMNPRPQGVPHNSLPQQQQQQYGYARAPPNAGAPASSWGYPQGTPGAGPMSSPLASPQHSAYGEVNPNAGYTQEEAIRAGRFGPARGDAQR